MAKIIFKIQRFNPKNDKAPYYKEYTLEIEKGMTVLDCLNSIKWYQDGALSFRRSCRSAICGSCAININGANGLACYTQVADLKSKSVKLLPLPGYKIIKDLVVDMAPFFEKYNKIRPYLITKTKAPQKERIQSEEEHKVITDVINCIMCSSCTSSCPSFWSDKNYLGPAALVKAYRFIADSRDEGDAERLPLLNSEDGLWRCHTIYNCVEDCPKKIDTTFAIAQLKKHLVKKSLGVKGKKFPAPAAAEVE